MSKNEAFQGVKRMPPRVLTEPPTPTPREDFLRFCGSFCPDTISPGLLPGPVHLVAPLAVVHGNSSQHDHEISGKKTKQGRVVKE